MEVWNLSKHPDTDLHILAHSIPFLIPSVCHGLQMTLWSLEVQRHKPGLVCKASLIRLQLQILERHCYALLRIAAFSHFYTFFTS